MTREEAAQLRWRMLSVLDSLESAQDDAKQAFAVVRNSMVRRDLQGIPLSKLKETTAGNVRVGVLERAGYSTVLSVIEAGRARLLLVPGVGEQTVMQVLGAANQVARAVKDSFKFRIDLDERDADTSRLLSALSRYESLERGIDARRSDLDSCISGLADDLVASQAAGSRLRWMFKGRAGKARAAASILRLRGALSRAEDSGLLDHVSRLEREAARERDDSEAWAEFRKRPVEFYGLLERLVGLKIDAEATAGFLPAEVIEQVNSLDLDESFRRVSLRGYQVFGAKFAIVQRRVIIGDEMGLGKTIQALAAFAHLRANGGRHFLVVCPASVLINWMREIGTRTGLAGYQLHGPDRVINSRRWLDRGDVGVTTFEALQSLHLPDGLRVSALVVDEAHFVKNPDTKRTRAVRAMMERSDRVALLTGTPIENRVDEFTNLVSFLKPEVAERIGTRERVLGPDAFRRAVAPVYLRRNQVDVLQELPDLIQVDEWEEFGREDFLAYRAAVFEGNFMAMRRAAFASRDPRSSPKLRRLLEIADEAGDNGHKVIVFSYFRDVLDKVHAALGSRAFGPLSGSDTPAKRQQLLDTFSASTGPAVLVSQIQAGGVGLNMQAGSVVILCEPQVKPSMESQAIARAHRMGQLRTVQVHRLLTTDSVDQRMLEILDTKQRIFDDYARHSDIAASSPDAVDVSQEQLARDIVASEQERLAFDGLDEAVDG